MKELMAVLLVLACLLTFVACSNTDKAGDAATAAILESARATETESQNEVMKYFVDRFDLMFTLWGPEGHGLYAFYIFPTMPNGNVRF